MGPKLIALFEQVLGVVEKPEDPRDEKIRQLRREIQKLRYDLQCAENRIFNLQHMGR